MGRLVQGVGAAPETEVWEQLERSGQRADWVRVSVKNSGVC